MGATLSECAGLASKNMSIEESKRRIEEHRKDFTTDFIVIKKGKKPSLPNNFK